MSDEKQSVGMDSAALAREFETLAAKLELVEHWNDGDVGSLAEVIAGVIQANNNAIYEDLRIRQRTH